MRSCARLLKAHGRIVVVGGDADRELAEEILEAAGESAIDATGQLSLLASAELIGRAALLVTNDSVPLHLASAMNTPTVAVFGPTVPEFGFGPLAERAVVVGNTALDVQTVRQARTAALPPRTLALYARDYSGACRHDGDCVDS